MPALTRCPDVEILHRLHQGTTSRVELAALEPHLLACQRCAQALDGLTSTDPLAELARKRSPAAQRAHDPKVQDLIRRLCQLGPAETAHTRESGGETAFEGGIAMVEPAVFDFLSPAQAPDELGRLGTYRVLKVLGQGGMGVVFQAEDPHLKRAVALKAMLPEVAKKDTARDRFLREARAAAALEHDHIVTIYHVSEERGVPYLVMPMLKGASLEAFLKKKQAEQAGPPLSVNHILKVSREIAKGLAAAHEVGLIHRDIKPANIWLDATAGGRVKILDFGLARSESNDSTITQTGMVVGTPAYMAPEQATGQKIDGRADLFSLGVVMYRLCTGRLPWQGETAMATLMLAATEEPPSLNELCPQLPTKLTELVMQLLAKKPDQRPKNAKAVVAAITAIEKELAGDKIQTNVPVSQVANPWDGLDEPGGTIPALKSPVRKPTRRWPMVAAAVLLAGGAVVAWQVIIRVEDKDGNKKVQLVVPTGSTVTDTKGGTVVARVPDKGPDVAAVPEKDDWLRSVQEFHKLGVADRVRLLEGHTDLVGAVAISRDNRQIATGSNDGTIRLWDVQSGKHLRTFKGHETTVNCVAFSKDGKLLLSGSKDYTARLWNADTGEELRKLKGKDGWIWGVAISPDQTRALTSGTEIGLWSLITGEEIRVLEGLPLDVKSVAFSPDGERAVAGGKDGTIRLWDVTTGKQSQLLKGHTNVVRRVVFSADGRRLLSSSYDRTVRLWDLDTSKELQLFGPSGNWVQTVAFAPDGRHALSAGWDETIRIWDLTSNKEVAHLEPHIGKIEEIALSADGGFLVVGGFDKSARILQLSDPRPRVAETDLAKWCVDVQKMPPKKQVEAVVAKLKELNPGFDGKVEHRLTADGQAVRDVEFKTDAVSDISPLRALQKLKFLACDGSGAGRGKLTNLSPLAGLQLTWLQCGNNPVTDLSPLRGMKFESLGLWWTSVTDLAPLAGMQVDTLVLASSSVTDLTPLKTVQIQHLDLQGCKITDFRPIQDLPLREVKGNFLAGRDADILRSIKTLAKINDKAAADFLKEVANTNAAFEQWIKDTQKLPAEKQVEAFAAKLKELNPSFDGKVTSNSESGVVTSLGFFTDDVSDIRPVRALLPGLKKLVCRGETHNNGQLTDLEPLRGSELRELDCSRNGKLRDLRPLANLPLRHLTLIMTAVDDLAPLAKCPDLWLINCSGTHVRDLAPIQNLRLTQFYCSDTKVSDFTPLKEMPLEIVHFARSSVTDLTPLKDKKIWSLECTGSPVRELTLLPTMRLRFLWATLDRERDAALLRSIPTLEKINDQPVADFFK